MTSELNLGPGPSNEHAGRGTKFPKRFLVPGKDSCVGNGPNDQKWRFISVITGTLETISKWYYQHIWENQSHHKVHLVTVLGLSNIPHTIRYHMEFVSFRKENYWSSTWIYSAILSMPLFLRSRINCEPIVLNKHGKEVHGIFRKNGSLNIYNSMATSKNFNEPPTLIIIQMSASMYCLFSESKS